MFNPIIEPALFFLCLDSSVLRWKLQSNRRLVQSLLPPPLRLPHLFSVYRPPPGEAGPGVLRLLWYVLLWRSVQLVTHFQNLMPVKRWRKITKWVPFKFKCMYKSFWSFRNLCFHWVSSKIGIHVSLWTIVWERSIWNLWECRSSSLSTVFLSFTLCVGLQRLHLPSIVFACFWMFSLLVAAQLMLNNGSISNRLWKWWRVNLHKLFFARWIVFFSLVKFHCFKRLWRRTKAAAFVNLWKKEEVF